MAHQPVIKRGVLEHYTISGNSIVIHRYKWLNSMVYGRYNELLFMGIISQMIFLGPQDSVQLVYNSNISGLWYL